MDWDKQAQQVAADILERERQNGWRRKKASHPHLYEEIKEYLRMGRYVFKTTRRFIVLKDKLKVLDYSLQGILTNTEILAFLLERELDKQKIKKIWYKSNFKDAITLYFPYKYKVGVVEGVKVDIKSCFYTIYSKLGVDVNCINEIDHTKKLIHIKAIGRGRITKENSTLIEMLEKEKEMRNTIYGLTRCCFYTAFYPSGKIKRQYFRSRIQNLDLTVVIASILHHIVDKFNKDIIYWNIDGGIVKYEAYEKIKEYVESLGFTLKKEAEGPGQVLGLGSYSIGEYATLHWHNGVKAIQEEKSYIYRVEGIEKILNWLRREK